MSTPSPGSSRPATPSAPPLSTPAASPLVTPSPPAPVTPSSPPTATPSAPSPVSSSPPPTETPSALPLATSSPPALATPSAPSPATPSAPPPSTPSAPPSATPSFPPLVNPSLPPPATHSPPPPPEIPAPSPSPPSAPSPSPPTNPSRPPPPPSSTSPPSSTPSPPPPPKPPSTHIPPPPPSGPLIPSPPQPASSPSSSSTSLVVGIVIGGTAALVVLILLFLCFRKKKRTGLTTQDFHAPPPPPPPTHKSDPHGGTPQYWQQNAPPIDDQVARLPPFRPPPPPPPVYGSSSGGSIGSGNYSCFEHPYLLPSIGISLGFSKSIFTFEELRMATDGFSNANLLGQGGFGFVHKGVLPNGKEVAVKQLKAGSGQGEREFQAEVETISRVHHKHLVSLVGYCITGAHRLLVYEFVPNNTLEFHLHGKDRPTMDWPSRLKIALGASKGLAYLHEDCHPKIIHRDIKASNILLDFKVEAKVADFGLAKFSSDANTHISTRVMGTFGYLAPEYASSGKLTEKSDVFSFGVVLLELITGRKPVNMTNTDMDDSLVDWARPLLTRALELEDVNNSSFDSLVDPKLQGNYNKDEMTRMAACAAACVRHSARGRPRMSQVTRALEGDASLSDLNEGTQPGYSSIYSSYGSSDYGKTQYKEDLKKLRRTVFSSQEYSESTSEYGIHPSGSSAENTGEMEMRKMESRSGGS
ncbi:hypothetical protein SAY87_019025 [Trapa incisa]|uniref:non-specific serine/threonine protein kinase n=1 Tax=Trapa incisa TaxID=236973 RepID=A0AAN7K3U6_9MYRT|nr:hypothetical protein SAY87_019025 [Trapa incisa]